MDTANIRPTWLTALLPLLAVYQYGDRSMVRAELFRMALSADAAATSADALHRIANMLDRDDHVIEMHRDELRALARAALVQFERVPPRAPYWPHRTPESNNHCPCQSARTLEARCEQLQSRRLKLRSMFGVLGNLQAMMRRCASRRVYLLTSMDG